MNKFKLFIPLALTFASNLYSQEKTQDYRITMPEEKVLGSLYSSIDFLDSRYDTSNFGIVQLGAFNRKAQVVIKTHLSIQFTEVLKALNEERAGNGSLLIQLRHFNFAEITGATKERGYCHIKADLYANQHDRYTLLNSIDTVVVIKSMDVTRPMFRRGSELLVKFIASALQLTPSQNTSYTYTELLRIDNIEKQSLPLFTAIDLKDGVYKTYDSFKRQEPDEVVKLEFKKDKITAVKILNADGSLSKIKSSEIYALVDKNKAYIGTDYGYYPLHKVDNDLRFTGKAKVSASTGDVIAASVFFGLIGGLIASDANAVFEMKIDHNNGGFIRLKEVKTNQ